MVHITTETDSRKIGKWTLAAAIGGLLFNLIFDPLAGYFYKLVILGKPAAELTLAWNIASTSINLALTVLAAVSVFLCVYKIEERDVV